MKKPQGLRPWDFTKGAHLMRAFFCEKVRLGGLFKTLVLLKKNPKIFGRAVVATPQQQQISTPFTQC